MVYACSRSVRSLQLGFFGVVSSRTWRSSSARRAWAWKSKPRILFGSEVSFASIVLCDAPARHGVCCAAVAAQIVLSPSWKTRAQIAVLSGLRQNWSHCSLDYRCLSKTCLRRLRRPQTWTARQQLRMHVEGIIGWSMLERPI